jgi:hypothetical protein
MMITMMTSSLGLEIPDLLSFRTKDLSYLFLRQLKEGLWNSCQSFIFSRERDIILPVVDEWSGCCRCRSSTVDGE